VIDRVTYDQLAHLLVEAEDHPRLTPWEKSFAADNRVRLEEWGLRYNCSPKVLVIMQRMADKLRIKFDAPEADEGPDLSPDGEDLLPS
jgi:hypothetical protein